MMKWNKFWVKEEGKDYDEARRRTAKQKAVIYYLVALYIGYMGFSILKNRLSGDDTMSYTLAVLLASLLMIGAIWVALYTTKQMKHEFEQSEIKTDIKEKMQ
jgi:hypothetical protein